MALTVCLAAIWEDVVDDIPEDSLQDAVADLANVCLCVCIATGVKAFLNRLPVTQLRTLVIATTQMLAGWMWKALIAELIIETQAPVAKQLDTNLTAPGQGHGRNERVAWTCQGLSASFAVAATLVVVLLLRLLPTTKPAPGMRSCTSVGLALHFCDVLVGSCPLPLAWAWHHWLSDVMRAILQPHLLNPSSPLRSWTTYQLWLAHVTMCIVNTAVCLIILGALRGYLTSVFKVEGGTGSVVGTGGAGGAGSTVAARVARYEAISLKTLDFLCAWNVYEILTSLRQSAGTSQCFPKPTEYLLHDLDEAVTVLLMAAVALGLFLVALSRASRGNRLPSTVGGSAFFAACCAVLIGTVPIQLGWAVKALYNEIFDWVVHLNGVDDEKHETISDLAIACSIIFTLAALLGYSYTFGEIHRQLRAGQISSPNDGTSHDPKKDNSAARGLGAIAGNEADLLC